VSLFETSALTHTQAPAYMCPPSYFHSLSSSPTHTHTHACKCINVHTYRLMCCNTRTYLYIIHTYYYIVYTIVVYIFTRVSMCVETLAVTTTRTWRRYLDWAQCCEAIYIYIYVCVCVARIAFFSVWKLLALCTWLIVW